MDMPEIKLEFDKNGKVKGAYRVEHTESHQIIEEFMLAGNQAVATWLDDLKLNYPAPNPSATGTSQAATTRCHSSKTWA